jgi:hypothetical protein
MAEGGPVQRLLPVALLLLAKHRDLYRVLVEPDCGKGKVDVVDVVLVDETTTCFPMSTLCRRLSPKAGPWSPYSLIMHTDDGFVSHSRTVCRDILLLVELKKVLHNCFSHSELLPAWSASQRSYFHVQSTHSFKENLFRNVCR